MSGLTRWNARAGRVWATVWCLFAFFGLGYLLWLAVYVVTHTPSAV